jgi:cytochrome P450 / NADPH-cytochrome P450 reductase
MKKAREEVDSVLGEGSINPSMISKLPYISAVIRETLRLFPTAPGFSVKPISTNDEDYPMHIGRARYPVQRGETLVASLTRIHRDPAVFGEDVEEFRPERMLDEHYNKLPKNSYKVRIYSISLVKRS